MMMLAVTGAASLMMSVITGRREAYDRPSDWCATMFLRKSPYWIAAGRSSPTSFRTRSTWSGGTTRRRSGAPRLRRHQEEDDVRHHGHGDEHAGPEQPSHEIPEHLSEQVRLGTKARVGGDRRQSPCQGRERPLCRCRPAPAPTLVRLRELGVRIVAVDQVPTRRLAIADVARSWTSSTSLPSSESRAPARRRRGMADLCGRSCGTGRRRRRRGTRPYRGSGPRPHLLTNKIAMRAARRRRRSAAATYRRTFAGGTCRRRSSWVSRGTQAGGLGQPARALPLRVARRRGAPPARLARAVDRAQEAILGLTTRARR